MESWRNAGVIDDKTSIFRSICVNKATVNESTQTIKQVTPNLEGVTQIKNLNPYELQQAETMASCGGVDYEDFTNIKKNTKINKLGNEVSENMQVNMREGSCINVRSVDFGAGAEKFTVRAKGTGTLDIYFGSKPMRKPTTTMEFSSTEMEDHTIEVDATKFKGVKNVCFLVSAGDDVFIDAWQFTEVGSGIHEMNIGNAKEKRSYDLSGRRLTDSNQHQGIVIEQYIDENGVKHSFKILSGKQY